NAFSTIMAPHRVAGYTDHAFGGVPCGSGTCHSKRRSVEVKSRVQAGPSRVPQDEYQTQWVRRRANDTLFEAGSRAPLDVEPGGIICVCEVATGSVAADDSRPSARAAPSAARG